MFPLPALVAIIGLCLIQGLTLYVIHRIRKKHLALARAHALMQLQHVEQRDVIRAHASALAELLMKDAKRSHTKPLSGGNATLH